MTEHLSSNPGISLNRRCTLCGEPMGKHIAPPYGARREEVGAMGLYCPIDPRVKEFAPTHECWFNRDGYCVTCGKDGGPATYGP